MSEDTIRQTVHAIWTLTESRGIPPTVRGVQQQLGLSSSSVAHERIRQVRERDLATMEQGFARALRLVRNGEPS